MAVRETQLNSEQKAKEAALQAEGEADFASKLAQSMDLPQTLTEAIDTKGKNIVEPETVPEEEEETEEVEEQTQEEAAEDTGDKKDELDEEEDLIPKSKVQKRIDELTAKIKRLESDLGKSAQEKEAASEKDNQLKQLESMSETQLRDLKRQVRVEQIKAGQDEAKLSNLLDLEEKIEQTIRSAPQRFSQSQITKFNSAVSETSDELGDRFDSVKADIFNYAKSIYDQSPALHQHVSGQATAWKLAVEHYNALRKVSEGKSDTDELKRQVNTLKKKISVDTTSKKAVIQQDPTRQLFKKALVGNDADKAAFLRKRVALDGLVSEEEFRNLGG